jgi:hypothetical protein
VELDERLHPVQLEILKKMSVPEKARLTEEMSRAVLEARFANLRAEHPDWTERQLLRRFCEILYGSDLAAAAYP